MRGGYGSCGTQNLPQRLVDQSNASVHERATATWTSTLQQNTKSHLTKSTALEQEFVIIAFLVFVVFVHWVSTNVRIVLFGHSKMKLYPENHHGHACTQQHSTA